jgi:CBS domain containing-hemolysin-like protein
MGSDAFKLLAVPIFVLLNGFFVAAEYSLVSVRKTRIDELAEGGNRMARLVLRAKSDPTRFISATQLGVTMTSLALGWVAEPTLAPLIRPLFDFLPEEGAVVTSHLVAGVVAYFIITLLHIVVGEQVPKMLALQRSEATVMVAVGPMSWLSWLFRPMIALLYWLTTLALKLLHLKWEGEHSLVYTENELKMIVTASQEKGVIEESEQELIVRVFGFADVHADEVMVPRTEMEALPATATLDEVTAAVSRSGHARYPVYDRDIDDVIGVFHVKDLYRFQSAGRPRAFDLRRMVRTPLIVPAAMPLDELLAMMKRRRTHVAMVLDEYGGTAGMVTLEDVLERIVGDVRDEFEGEAEEVEVSANGEVHLSGLLSIDDVNERFELAIEDPFYNTIGGYVFGQLGRRPEIGDEVRADGHVFRVEAMDGLRIDRLQLISAAENALEETRDEADGVAVRE